MAVSAPIDVTKFASSFEFRTRPAFREDVVTNGATPYKIIGTYRFDDPVRCGVKDCPQMHLHGYVVLVGEGIETNTGWDCGLDHFGVEFLSMRKEFDRAEREIAYRVPLRKLVAEAPSLRARFHALQQQKLGGEWLLTNLRQFAKLYPAPVLTILQGLAPRSEVKVYELPARAGATMVGDGADVPRHARDLRGAVRGLGIFGVDTQNWPLFQLELELNELVGAYNEDMSFNQVLQWFRWSELLESKLEDFQHLLNEGKRFFTRSNLNLLPLLIEDEKLREQLSWVVWSNGSVESKPTKPAPPPKAAPRENSLQRMLKRFIPPQP